MRPKNWGTISTSAKDLVTRLLDSNPATRLTVEDALEHPWIKVRLTPSHPSLSPSLHHVSGRHAVLDQFLYFYIFFKYTLLSLSGNSGRLTWERVQQPQEPRYPVLQVHAGSFRVSVIHRTLTWTTRFLTCARDPVYARVYTRGGWAHRQRIRTTFLTRKNSSHTFCLCSRRSSILGSWNPLDVESVTLPTETPRHSDLGF